jgi:alpha-beta hydrolase superfamily lysophospholipase
MAAVEGTVFSCAAEVHPSAMAVEDATKVTIPIVVLASQDEDATTVKGFEEALTVPKYVEIYPDAPHVSISQLGFSSIS